MPKFNYEINIDAPSEKEADSKIQSVTVMVSKLNTRELDKLAQVIKNDPVKLAFAKKALGV